MQSNRWWFFISIVVTAVFLFSCQKETPTQMSEAAIQSPKGNQSFAKQAVTRGDVEAVFNAFTTGGRVILYQASSTAGFFGAPGDLTQGSIRPLPYWDGLHFSAEDWHVILLGIFDGGDQSYTYQDADEVLSPIKITFTLNGEQLQTERTPIKRFLEPSSFGLDVAYGFQQGIILAPGELPAGAYVLHCRVEDPELGAEEIEIHFFVDA